MRARIGKKAKFILMNELKSRELLQKIIEAGKDDAKVTASVVHDKKTYTFSEMNVQ